MASKQTGPSIMNKKKKFVADGVFQAELHSFLTKALSTAGYAGIEVRVTPVKTEIRIKATKVQDVLGVDGRKIRELTSLVQKRFNYPKDAVELSIVKIQNKGLCASAQAEACKFKLLSQVPVRMAANSIIRGVINEGARGCQVIISGKLQQQRAKSMKFNQGQNKQQNRYMVHTGQPRDDYVDIAVRHVFFKQGIMGVKVKIMLPYDSTGKNGCPILLPDAVTIRDPKVQEEEEIRAPVVVNQTSQ